MDDAKGNVTSVDYDGPMLHERIFRKMKQDNMNEHRYLMRKEKLIQKEVRFIKSKITMEKKLLEDKSMISAARIRRLEQEDDLIKGKQRKKPQKPQGPPHTEKRLRRKRGTDFGNAVMSHQSEENIFSDEEDEVNLQPPPFLPPIYRQKAVFPRRQLYKPRKADNVKVEELYDCRYLRLSVKQQMERESRRKADQL